MRLQNAKSTPPSSEIGPPTSSGGSISVFIAYPERYEGLEPPEWAAKAFHEDEVPARVALNAVRTGEPTEVMREIGPMGFWGAWWAVEIRVKRSRDGNPDPEQHRQADERPEGAE